MARMFIGLDRRNFTKRMTRMLRDERQRLWASYYKASSPPADQREQALKEFCSELLSYVAFGQFNLYKPYADGMERRENVAKSATRLYPEINESTYRCIQFCETCENNDYCSHALPAQLAEIGEELMNRARQEDQIVAALSV